MSLHRTVRRVIPFLGGVAARLGIPIPFRPAPDPVWTVLAAFAASRSGRAATFVQIGSNDGTTGDPLRTFTEANDWSGLLVEPVPYVFARLQRER
jgi:hypothetical protein